MESRRFCPLINKDGQQIECRKDCAWYVDYNKMCAMSCISMLADKGGY